MATSIDNHAITKAIHSPTPRTQLFRVPSADSSRLATKYAAEFAIAEHSIDETNSAPQRRKRRKCDPRKLTIYMPRTKWMITFAIITFAQAVALIALFSWAFNGDWNGLDQDGMVKAPPGLTLAVLGQTVIGIFEAFYQVVLVFDAGRRKNIVQIAGVCLNNVSMLALFAIFLSGVTDTIESVDIGHTEQHHLRHIAYTYQAIVGVLALTTFLMVGVTWLGFKEFEW